MNLSTPQSFWRCRDRRFKRPYGRAHPGFLAGAGMPHPKCKLSPFTHAIILQSYPWMDVQEGRAWKVD